MMRLMEYDVEIKCECGPEMYLADTIFQSILATGTPKADQEVERIHSVDFLPVSEPQIQEIWKKLPKILSCSL